MRRFNPEKELNKIQHGNKTRVILFVISLLVVGLIGYSFALYQVRYSKRIIYTKVAPFNNKDIELAIYLDDAPSIDNLFPEKNSGYLYSKTVCDNGSRASFDNLNWELNLKSKGKDKCNVYFIKDSSIPNPPELYQGLIPVAFDTSGKVLVANPTNNDWYNYDDHRWANAVLVNTTKYNELTFNGNVREEKYGTEINMSDILQMYVWIPRYKYQLFNAVNGESVEEQEIKIQFEGGTASTGDVSCTINNKGVESCTNAANGNWYTHPAFTFGNTDLTGIWVGKFETSHTTKSKGNGGTDASAALNCINDTCSEADNIRIIPNVPSLRYNTVSNFFYVSRSIEKTNNIYNLNITEIDTHLTKNMEWGAMAYLTHSKYGRCTAGGCTEVAMNSNSNFITGYNGTANTWNTTEGQKASTTGNLYGIYDTNGGSYEYMMSAITNETGSAIYYSESGFSAADLQGKEKYYELYEYDTVYTLNGRGHLGDATRETLKTFGTTERGWYGDSTGLPGNNLSWLLRSGDVSIGDLSGTFSSARDVGHGFSDKTLRVVLTAEDKA